MRKLKMNGFQLIELCTTVVILGILTTISLPLYSHYQFLATRIEACQTLNKLALALELYHLKHETYQNANLDKLKIKSKIGSSYTVKIKNASDSEYRVVAEPQNPKANQDANCGTLILDSNGKKTISGNAAINECW